MKWKPTLTIRENHIGDRKGIQLSDPINMKRLLVAKEDMLELIAGIDSERKRELESALADQGALAEDWSSLSEWSAGLDHWEKRNWNLALSYYLWARRDTFLDEGPEYESIRCEALNTMLSQSDLPLPSNISDSERIDLGDVLPIPQDQSVGAILQSRRTTQVFRSDGTVDSHTLGGLLKESFSVSRRHHTPDIKEHIHNILHGVGFSFDPYLAVFNVDGLTPGIYYYNISQDRMRLESEGDYRQDVCAALIGHNQALTAACTVFLVVDFQRFQWRYRHERALRNLYVDAGRMAQYLILVATAFGLKNHITPATVDTSFATLLNIDPERRQVFYGITLGH
jgi:SagB-type dehydrogenase family enzyme